MSEGKQRVLLVDDEPSIIKMTSMGLKLEGFEVLVAVDGEEALAKARAEHPDLIILDLMLPKLSGFEVCATLKQGQDTREIPIVIFTAKGEDADKKRCLELGAVAYFTKGPEAGSLIERVKSALQERSGAGS